MGDIRIAFRGKTYYSFEELFRDFPMRTGEITLIWFTGEPDFGQRITDKWACCSEQHPGDNHASE